MGVSPSYVSRVARGKRESAEVLRALEAELRRLEKLNRSRLGGRVVDLNRQERVLRKQAIEPLGVPPQHIVEFRQNSVQLVRVLHSLGLSRTTRGFVFPRLR